ncbi:hypothetical protein K438DRAFT_1768737 [Mycena galopus ATCC 62051]|nr:hypothetical protein K438DRAFT_1768737 [Mycena galopus ATCC 62051]
MKRISIPRGHSPLPMGTLSQLPPSSSPRPFSSPLPLRVLPAESGRVGGVPSSPIRVSDSEQEDFPAFPPLPNKRKREESRPEPDTSDSDSDLVVKKKAKGKNARRTPKDSGNDGHQAITRQFRVPEIRDVQKVFFCWTVPQTDIEKDFAYRVDLTNDTREWLDPKNKPLSMAAIIKSEDQDSWGKGSAGSIKKPTKVLALDGVPFQVANNDCQGICICDQLDKDLLRSHERYAPDDNEMRELFEAERAVNVRETSSMAIRAAAFYSKIHSKPCPHLDNGVLCIGLPMNLDGKGGFIGCQNYSPGQPRSHRFITINRDVKEDLIRELLSNNGRFISDVNVDSESAICARALHSRSGGKSDRLCRMLLFLMSPNLPLKKSTAYTHIDQNHQVIKGKIIRRPCGAKIQIFSPIDHEDRRAMVYLTGSHNHPKFPAAKVSRDGKDAYRQAVDAAGVSGAYRSQMRLRTSKIFNGRIPAELDPALANPRIKRGLIAKIKRIGRRCYLSPEVDAVASPWETIYLAANLIHRVKVSLHDNTYARIHGEWKEWEVVIWDDRQNETYEVFKKMWPGLFETIARITDSEVKFKFIDGEGLKAILVDGNKPQANALGDYLVSRNRPHFSGIHEKDPKLILPNILRTCITHANRHSKRWTSSFNGAKILNKKSSEYLTPGDTHLNESAHPYTNRHTGTNLALLEAIDRAYDMDLQVEAKHRAMRVVCSLITATPSPSAIAIMLPAEQHIIARHLSVPKLEPSSRILRIPFRSRSAANTKELRERRKALKEASGIKKTKRSGEKAKETLPDADEFAGLSDAENIQSSPVHSALHLCNDASLMQANLDVELESALEPLFPAQYETPYLELAGDLTTYFPLIGFDHVSGRSFVPNRRGGKGGSCDTGQWKWKWLSRSGNPVEVTSTSTTLVIPPQG